MDTSQQTEPAAPPAAEPCPTPLEWREVLVEFRAQRQSVAVQAGDVAITAATFGTGRPLYVLGPAPGTHEQFALLAWLLREDFRCVFIEYRPLPSLTFRSSAPALPLLAADVTAIADRLGDDRFAVCSTSFGSLVALQLAVDEPDRIDAITLVCGYARREYSWFEQGLIAYGRFMPGRLSWLRGWKSLQEHNHRPWFPPFDPTRWEFLRADLASTPTSQLARRLAVSSRADFRPLLPRIHAPVLLVRTEGDGQVLTACQDELEAGLPHVRSEWLHSTGHFPHLTHPHRLAKLLKAFLLDAHTMPQQP
jgi:pimeloyl-ACP methyl ester carboxylesterase